MRSLIRRAGEAILVGVGAAKLAARSRRGLTLVLAYHNVVRTGDDVPGDRSLHLDFDSFRRQLDIMQELGDVVPLDATKKDTDPDGRPRFVITFDDAYRGTVLLALPELQARGIPSTIFVPPGLLGTDGFWWDAVPVSAWENPMPLGELRGEDVRVRAWAREQGLRVRPVPPLQQASTVGELGEAVAGGGATLACHTWDHPNLTALGPEEIAGQLNRALEWLEAARLPWIRWVSYPYGQTSEEVCRVASALGFQGGLRVDGGWMPRHPRDWMNLPRQDVPAGLSARGFRLLLSGLRRGGWNALTQGGRDQP